MNRIFWSFLFGTSMIHAGCKNKPVEKKEVGKYVATSALKIDTSYNREYVSQIQSVRNIEVRAQEKGYLESINVDEGQLVHAGQLLFKIMPKIFEAELQKAQAQVKQAELEEMNTKTLSDKNIVSKSELAMAQAKLDEAKADEAMARLHLSLTEIRAPFDGITDRIRFKLGSLIDEGSLLTTLSDNKNVYAYFNVSENEYLDYKSMAGSDKNKTVSLMLANGQEHKYKGTIETVEGEFDNETGNIAFRAKFPNPDFLLKHGETGKVRMTVPVSNALIIPQKATYEIQDKVFVFVVDKNNVISSRNISIAKGLPDIYMVSSGLAEGEKILLEGVQNVKDGDKIQYLFKDPKEVLAGIQLIKQ
jgi:membrane fusion protein (multidrug efflux system)